MELLSAPWRRAGLVGVFGLASLALHLAGLWGVGPGVGLPHAGRPESAPVVVSWVAPPTPVAAQPPPLAGPTAQPAPRQVSRPARPAAAPRASVAELSNPPTPAVSVAPTSTDLQPDANDDAASAEAARVGQSDETEQAGRADTPLPAVAEAVPPGAPMPPLPTLPAPMRQRFRVYWGDFDLGNRVGRLEYRLEVTDDRYTLRTAAQAEGLIALFYAGTLEQASTGRVEASGLQPLRYAEQRPKRPERAVTFEPSKGRLLTAAGESVPLPAGTQDRLSVFYQLGLVIRAQPDRYPAGTAIDLPVASFKAVRTERFVVVGEELLALPQGQVSALHLSRLPTSTGEDPRIEVWLGSDSSLLPVRLRVEDINGRVLDQVIEPAD